MGSAATLSFIAAAGFLFMSANLVLKLMGHMPVYILYPAVGASILAGCWFQAAAFRETQFGLVVVMVLGLEMLFSVLVARTFLGEIYSGANIAGIMLVIAGMALVHLPANAQAVAESAQDAFPHVDARKGPRSVLPDATRDH
jgi:drug/metabolite transporter (DMT)-like permease